MAVGDDIARGRAKQDEAIGICRTCESMFFARNRRHKYCSIACREMASEERSAPTEAPDKLSTADGLWWIEEER